MIEGPVAELGDGWGGLFGAGATMLRLQSTSPETVESDYHS